MYLDELSDKDCLYRLSTDLEDAPRSGKEKDEPEGVRYIQMSDTLACIIVEKLRSIAHRMVE